jgi:hypothetical protein
LVAPDGETAADAVAILADFVRKGERDRAFAAVAACRGHVGNKQAIRSSKDEFNPALADLAASIDPDAGPWVLEGGWTETALDWLQILSMTAELEDNRRTREMAEAEELADEVKRAFRERQMWDGKWSARVSIPAIVVGSHGKPSRSCVRWVTGQTLPELMAAIRERAGKLEYV